MGSLQGQDPHILSWGSEHGPTRQWQAVTKALTGEQWHLCSCLPAEGQHSSCFTTPCLFQAAVLMAGYTQCFLPSYFPKCQKGSPSHPAPPHPAWRLEAPGSSETANYSLAVLFPSLHS